jgi:dTDP-4-amino-4,6-dideoxygalactose transaminase
VGATPVFCDVLGDEDLNLDPDDLAAAITPRTKAAIVLHYGGFACDLEAVGELADRRGIIVVEDAAHAPGARWRGRALGTVGDVGCFSFFSNKNVPVGEGGMIVTSDDAIAGRLRLLRSHGMTTLTWQRHRGHASAYDVIEPGLNYRIDELRATLAIVQLQRLADGNAARLAHVLRYREVLDGVEGLSFPFRQEERVHDSANHLAVVLLPRGISRDDIREAARAEGVQTSVHYPPIHRFTAYAESAGARALPRTDAVADRILTLPLFPHMTSADVDLVADVIADAVRRA